MSEYMQLPNETIVLTDDSVHCDNIKGRQDGKLILTNMRLVYEWSGKRRTGGNRSCLIYPLNELETQADEIRTDCRASDYEATMKLYPGGREISFIFSNPEKNASRKMAASWLDAISMEVLGTRSPAAASLRRSVPGVEMFAGMIKDTVDRVKTSLDVPTAGGQSALARKAITTKCIGCNAPLSGRTGMTVQCGYCDTVQTLQ